MVTNTLAYCNTELITAVKSFIVQAIAGVATMTSKLLHNQKFFFVKIEKFVSSEKKILQGHVL